MANRDDFNDARCIIDSKYDAILTHAEALRLLSLEFLHPSMSRCGYQCQNRFCNAVENLLWQRVHISLCGSFDPDLIVACRTHDCFSAR